MWLCLYVFIGVIRIFYVWLHCIRIMSPFTTITTLALHLQGGWGISADSRFNGGGVDILEGITTAKNGGKTIGIFLRDMAEKRATYKEALEGAQASFLDLGLVILLLHYSIFLFILTDLSFLFLSFLYL